MSGGRDGDRGHAEGFPSQGYKDIGAGGGGVVADRKRARKKTKKKKNN